MKRTIIMGAIVALLLTGCLFYDECRSQCNCWYAKSYSSCGGIVP